MDKEPEQKVRGITDKEYEIGNAIMGALVVISLTSYVFFKRLMSPEGVNGEAWFFFILPLVFMPFVIWLMVKGKV